MKKFIANGGAWVLAQMFLLAAILALGPMFRGQWDHPASRAAGALLFAGGAVFGVAGVKVLGRNRTPFPRPRDGSRLIQNGIYSVARHPLYTSLMLLSAGWGLLWQNVPTLVAAGVLSLLLERKARAEERWLREKFPEYADYARRVPRFLPRPRRR